MRCGQSVQRSCVTLSWQSFILTTIYLSESRTMYSVIAYLTVCIISDIALPPAIAEVLPTKSASPRLSHWQPDLPVSFPSSVFASVRDCGFRRCPPTSRACSTWRRCCVGCISGHSAARLCRCDRRLSDLPPLPFFHRGDYSYGIYIFGFPIQQTVTQFTPHAGFWWFNLSIALPVTLVFAATSWHAIEKPALDLRKRFLRSASSRAPVPVPRWGKREWGIAAVAIIYGLLIATVADVSLCVGRSLTSLTASRRREYKRSQRRANSF